MALVLRAGCTATEDWRAPWWAAYEARPVPVVVTDRSFHAGSYEWAYRCQVVLAGDKTGFLKKGTKSAGVQRQY